MSRKIIQGLFIGALAAATALILQYIGRLDWLENKTWDWRVRALARPGAETTSVKAIEIDQASLDWVDENLGAGWPWPRELYVPILAACHEAGGKAVIFDMIFTEPSDKGVSDDVAFGEQLAQMDASAVPVVASGTGWESGKWPGDISANSFEVAGLSNYLSHAEHETLLIGNASFPIPQVATNITMLGDVTATPDNDAIIRRMPAFRFYDDRCLPSLGLTGFIMTHPESRMSVSNNTLSIGKLQIPLDNAGRMILRFRGPTGTHHPHNAAAIMRAGIHVLNGDKPDMDLSELKDKYLLLGVVAQGAKDLRPTPLSEKYPGVELHATILDNALSGDFMRDAPYLLCLLLTLILAVTSAIIIRLSQKGLHVAIASPILVAIPPAIGFMGYQNGYWIPVAVTDTAVFVSIAIGIIVNYTMEGRQKRFIKSAFKQYLSPAVIDRLVADPDHLQLGGEERTLSIYFSDVQGFTGISESLGPTKLTELLNDYLTLMTDIILESGGTIDKYEGDAIIAFWNAPIDIVDHATLAVRSALRCQKVITENRARWKDDYGKDIYARIGMNTGPVVVGNMGSNQRFDYTFLGDAGNLAARLEGINKQFGTYLMISQNTRDLVEGDEFAMRELSRVRVVGKNEPVTVYEPMYRDDYAARSEQLEVFDKGLHAFYDGNFKDAISMLEKIADQDPAAASYIRKCRSLLDNPPADWDGVWVMTEK